MVKVAMAGIAGMLLAIFLKQQKSEYAILVTLGASVCILFFILNRMRVIVDTLWELKEYLQLDGSYIKLILKMIGITYLAEFTCGLCKDAGYGALGSQIELFGKLAIMAVSMPVLLALLDTIEGLL